MQSQSRLHRRYLLPKKIITAFTINNDRYHYRPPLQLASEQEHWSSSPLEHFDNFAWGPAGTPASQHRGSSASEQYGSSALVHAGSSQVEQYCILPLEPAGSSLGELGGNFAWGLVGTVPLEPAGMFPLEPERNSA